MFPNDPNDHFTHAAFTAMVNQVQAQPLDTNARHAVHRLW